jgi:prenyltransferase beta subunit
MCRFHAALVVFLVLLGPLHAQTADQKQATIAYVQRLQASDGGYLPSAPKDGAKSAGSGLRATVAALRVLKYCGGKTANKESCADFVMHCYDKTTGGFADRPAGKPDAVTTAVGLMALSELGIPANDYREPAIAYLLKEATTFEEIRMAAAGLEAIQARLPQAERWIAQIKKMEASDATFGKADGAARETGSAVVAIMRLGGAVERREKVTEVLKAGQRSDGGFGKEGGPHSDLETSYRVVRAFHMLHEKPDVNACLGFVARCRNADGGYGVVPGEPSTVGATYFASIIQHWLVGP